MKTIKLYLSAPEYCHPYFDLVETDDLIRALESSKQETLTLMRQIPPEKENFAYQQNKWTVKAVFRHIIDCERVYAYRAFRFSRFDDTVLSAFDEIQYIENVDVAFQTIDDITAEYVGVRNASISLFKSMTHEMLRFSGKVNDYNFTAEAIGFMTVGHNIHHCNVLKTKYL